jgi:CO/xanthine dehydrogenase Mo-binding subunit
MVLPKPRTISSHVARFSWRPIGFYSTAAVIRSDAISHSLSIRHFWARPPFLADAQALVTGATPYVPGGANPPGTLYTVEGSASVAEPAIAAADRIIDATYALPYVAHACMEVLNCTVDYVPGVKCDVYAPTQSARSVLSLVVTLTGLPANKISVYTTYLGGGLGRKSELDFVSQAVQVGMALGRPVKLMWPREEDFTHDSTGPWRWSTRRPASTATARSPDGPTGTSRPRSSGSAARRSARRATARGSREPRLCRTTSAPVSRST